MPTADDYARAVIAEGQRRGITPRGVQIALATVYVESDWLMYANSKVPDSLNIPHDAVGSDGFSVGLFQQQVVMGANGWWWGDAATCMDPALSAGLFYDRLAKLDYNGPNSPGSYAQAIQQSAFPDRYDQRFPDAVDLYNRLAAAPTPTPEPPVTNPNRPAFNEYPLWSPNDQSRAGTTVDLFLIHTEEGDSNADALARNFLDNPSSQVSYNYTISEDPNDHGVTLCDVVALNMASWSVLVDNDRSIDLVFAGSYAAWTRDQWLQQSNAIDVAAFVVVRDCAQFGIPLNVIAPPYNSPPPGISDHRYCTEYLKDGNTHTDVGDNFPWDVFAAAIQKYANPTPPTPGVFDMLSAQQQQDMYNWSMWTYAQLQGFNNAMIEASLPGCTPTPTGQGWPQLGQNPNGHNLTVVDALADIKDGITLPPAAPK
jgi:hypothetical protein